MHWQLWNKLSFYEGGGAEASRPALSLLFHLPLVPCSGRHEFSDAAAAHVMNGPLVSWRHGKARLPSGWLLAAFLTPNGAPHQGEGMPCDNAVVTNLLVKAGQASGDEILRDCATQTWCWMLPRHFPGDCTGRIRSRPPAPCGDEPLSRQLVASRAHLRG